MAHFSLQVLLRVTRAWKRWCTIPQDTEVPDAPAAHRDSGRDWRAGVAPRGPGAPGSL